MSAELQHDAPRLPAARPPRGLSWDERLEAGTWHFDFRPKFAGRQATWLIVGLVITTLAVMCQAPIVALIAVTAAVVGVVVRLPPQTLVLGPNGFSFSLGSSIEKLAEIDRFDTVVDGAGSFRPVTLLRAVVHGGPPIAYLLAPLDHASVRFVASRLNEALAEVRDARGYRG